MINPVVLNQDKHRDLCVIADRGAQYGESVQQIPVIADELAELAVDYPVFFTKSSETGQFDLSAWLGLEVGENLFLDDTGWADTYVPLHLLRQPFIIAMAEDEGGTAEARPVIAIDQDSARISRTKGEALFTDEGHETTFLSVTTKRLEALMRGIELTRAMITELLDHSLIKPFTLTVEFRDGQELGFSGLYTIDNDMLRDLPGDVLETLNRKGYLQACYMILASLANIRKLVALKDRRRSGAG